MKLSIFQKMNSINKFIAAAAVIIFPVSVLIVDNLSGLIFIIAIVLGLWHMAFHFKSLLPVPKDEKLFFLSLTFLLVTAIITTLINDADFARADRFIAFVLVIPAYYFFKHNLSDEKYVWYGLVLGSFVVLGVAVYQVFGETTSPRLTLRATGAVNQILFGDLALIMGAMSLAGIGCFKERKKWLAFIPVMAFISGVLASALSLARGGWLALPFLMIIFLWFFSKRSNTKFNVFVLAILILTIGGVYLVPQTGVQQRIETSFSNADKYFESTNVNDAARSSSIGSRFEMWKAAWIIFKDNPLVGGGWGNYMEKAQLLVDNGLVNKNAAIFYHPHNQFMSALAKGGLLGFMAISVLFLFHGIIFFRSIVDPASVETQRAALAGLLLVLGFVGFSITESIFERSRSIIFYAFYLSIFMASRKIVHTKKSKNLDFTPENDV